MLVLVIGCLQMVTHAGRGLPTKEINHLIMVRSFPLLARLTPTVAIAICLCNLICSQDRVPSSCLKLWSGYDNFPHIAFTFIRKFSFAHPQSCDLEPGFDPNGSYIASRCAQSPTNSSLFVVIVTFYRQIARLPDF